jgi:hemerythrin-like domain-containing protein
MKRAPQLQKLSADHHHALVLARALEARAASSTIDARLVTELRVRFDEALAPHFAVEEDVLLPALAAAGEPALVQRTLAEHASLRNHLAAAEAGDLDRVRTFAALLQEHVRFEERFVFPACEQKLDPTLLDQVARRTAMV